MRYGIGLAWLLATSVSIAAATDDKKALEKADVHLLETAKFPSTDTKYLIDFVQKRTMTEHEKIEIGATIQQLGSDSFRARTVATRKLISRGPVVCELLKEAQGHSDLEVANRAKKCLEAINEKRYPCHVPGTVVRLLGRRAPVGAAKPLLHHVPHAENLDVIQETKTALVSIAKKHAKAREVLRKGLQHHDPKIRAMAGFAYVLASPNRDAKIVAKLRKDASPVVRVELGKALAYVGDGSGVATIIQTFPELNDLEALRAEDWLHKVGQRHNPPTLYVGKTTKEKTAAQKAWMTWWENNQKKVSLANLTLPASTRGPTVMIFLDVNTLQEVGPGDRERWNLDKLDFPLDVQLLKNGRVLLAEYEAANVVERDRSGKVVWKQPVNRPIAAQRLANGNTFIVTDTTLYEFTSNNESTGFQFSFENQERILKATKRPSGDIICLTDRARVVRLESSGRTARERTSYAVKHSKQLFGGKLYFTPAGRVLIPHNAENKVIEYDDKGKPVWELEIEQPIAAVRLPNGNTLVTTMTQNRTLEVDRAGNPVWEFKHPTSRVTRALRR